MARASTSSNLTPVHSWAPRLAGFDDDRLGALLTARPDLGVPRPASFDQLATRASAWPSAQACYDGLDRTHRQLLEALCLLPGPSCAHLMAPLLGPSLDPDDLVAPLRRLEDLALVSIEDGHDVWLNPAFQELRFPAGLGPPAGAALERFPAHFLADVARRLGIKPQRNKGATLQCLATALSDPELVRRTVDAGPPGTAELAERLAAGPPTVAASGSYYYVADRTPVGWLTNRGLLVLPGWGEGCMPGEVGMALRGAVVFPGFSLHRPAPVTTAVDPVRVDTAATEAGLRLVGDLASLVADWEVAPAKVLKTGGVGVRDVRRAAAATGRSEAEAARIIELAAVAGLVGEDATAAVALPTPEFDQWQAADPGRRWAMVVSAWLSAGHHLSAAADAGDGGGAARPLLPRPASSAPAQRRAVLEALAQFPPGLSVDANGLGQAVTWARPALWAGPALGPADGLGSVLAEVDLLGVCAGGSFGTAGRMAADGRLDDAGRALSALAPALVSQFTVQADLTAVAPGTLAATVRAELDLLADVESTGAATVFRFSPSSLVRAFDAGRTSHQIEGWLSEHAKNRVPQPLSYLIADLGRRHGQLRVGRAGTYLRCDDHSLTAEVVRARTTAGLALRELAPGVLVTPAEPAAVMRILRSAGYLPAQEEADGTLVICRPVPRRAPRPAAAMISGSGSRGGRSAPPPPLSAVAGRADGGGADARASLDARAAVAGLRRAPKPSATGSMRAGTGTVRAGPPSGEPCFDDFVAALAELAAEAGESFGDLDDEAPARPTGIVKDRTGIRNLLDLALDQEWAVRVDYTNSRGQDRQLSLALTQLTGSKVQAAILPRWNHETLAVERIKWARVLTETEEEALL